MSEYIETIISLATDSIKERIKEIWVDWDDGKHLRQELATLEGDVKENPIEVVKHINNIINSCTSNSINGALIGIDLTRNILNILKIMEVKSKKPVEDEGYYAAEDKADRIHNSRYKKEMERRKKEEEALNIIYDKFAPVPISVALKELYTLIEKEKEAKEE